MEERFERYHADMEALRGAVLGSSARQRVMKLREAHREKVARNEVRVSPLWARPCRAYNVHHVRNQDSQRQIPAAGARAGSTPGLRRVGAVGRSAALTR